MGAFVYMLRCADGSFYVGSATGDDLTLRIAQHEAGAARAGPSPFEARRQPGAPPRGAGGEGSRLNNFALAPRGGAERGFRARSKAGALGTACDLRRGTRRIRGTGQRGLLLRLGTRRSATAPPVARTDGVGEAART